MHTISLYNSIYREKQDVVDHQHWITDLLDEKEEKNMATCSTMPSTPETFSVLSADAPVFIPGQLNITQMNVYSRQGYINNLLNIKNTHINIENINTTTTSSLFISRKEEDLCQILLPLVKKRNIQELNKIFKLKLAGRKPIHKKVVEVIPHGTMDDVNTHKNTSEESIIDNSLYSCGYYSECEDLDKYVLSRPFYGSMRNGSFHMTKLVTDPKTRIILKMLISSKTSGIFIGYRQILKNVNEIAIIVYANDCENIDNMNIQCDNTYTLTINKRQLGYAINSNRKISVLGLSESFVQNSLNSLLFKQLQNV